MYFAKFLNIYESIVILLLGVLCSILLNKITGYYKTGFYPPKHSFFENILFALQFFLIMWGGTSIIIKIFEYFGWHVS